MLATKYKIAVTTVKGKAFLIKIFTPFEKSFLSKFVRQRYNMSY